MIQISFSPKTRRLYQSKLTVFGMGTEQYFIKLRGIGGQPLHLIDKNATFGPVSLGNEHSKFISLQNLDSNISLPITIMSPCPDVVKMKPPLVWIPPLSKKSVEVHNNRYFVTYFMNKVKNIRIT